MKASMKLPVHRYFLGWLMMGCGGALAPDGPLQQRTDAGPTADASEGGDGAAPWCAADDVPCLGSGTEYDVPGHCCMSRMTCVKAAAGDATGICMYSVGCVGEDEPCVANGWELDVAGRCCNSRMACRSNRCAY